MTEIHAVRFPRQKCRQLRALRTCPGLEVHEANDELWLRVTETSEELQSALRGLPVATAYRVLEDGQLCRLGSRVPQGFLPQGPWESLSRWMQVEFPETLLPGQLADRVPFQLIRDSQPRDANLLLTGLKHWLDYGSMAAQVRLDCWHFAVSINGEALIRGVPLPPVPGQQFVEDFGIAVPCGWTWLPAVDGSILARVFSRSGRDLVLCREDGRIERIAEDQFVRATRSAIRLSAEALPHA